MPLEINLYAAVSLIKVMRSDDESNSIHVLFHNPQGERGLFMVGLTTREDYASRGRTKTLTE